MTLATQLGCVHYDNVVKADKKINLDLSRIAKVAWWVEFVCWYFCMGEFEYDNVRISVSTEPPSTLFHGFTINIFIIKKAKTSIYLIIEANTV